MSTSNKTSPLSLAAQLMAIEVISELLISTSPHKLGEALTEHLRELTGAKTVMVLAHQPEPAMAELLNVSPARRANLFSSTELNNFCPEKTEEELPFFPARLSEDHPLYEPLMRAGIKSMIRYPLMAGRELIGLLLLFDMPQEERISEINSIINLLIAPIALAIKNALAFRLIKQQTQELEQRVEERTIELRQKNAQLQASDMRHQTILQTAMDGIWLVDKQGYFLEVNETYCRMSGYSLQELLTMGIYDVQNRETRSETAAHIQKVIEQGKDRFESCHRRKDGTFFDVEVSVQYRSIEGGQIVVFVQDISDRKRAEEEKIALGNQLLQSQKMESIGRLAGGVAHDFNNMLTVILGHAELAILKLDQSHPIIEDLKEILKTAERSADLTRQLLAFARKQTIAPKVINLNETVTGMLKMLQRLIGEDKILTWQLNPNLWQVKLDPSQLDQILANLCVNAGDAIVGTGRITIETENRTIDSEFCATNPEAITGDYVRLSISDNGVGMDKETMAHIFEPFFTTKKMGKGTGLGLATVYGAVKQNNGFIKLYSEKGIGTTFSIYLPKAAENTPDLKQNRPDTQIPFHGQETILLVEDESSILNIAYTMLAKNGYTVLTANTPGEAICIARKHVGEIQMLLTDVILPEMNGRELAKNIQTLYPEIKLLFMSGYTSEAIARHGILNENMHFIQKPFSLPDMMSVVRKILDG